MFGIANTHHVVPNVNPNSDRAKLTLAWGAKAAAEPTRAKARANFMVGYIRGGVGVDMIIKIMRVTAAAQIARKIDVFASIIDRQFFESGGELTYSIVSCKLGVYSLIMVM